MDVGEKELIIGIPEGFRVGWAEGLKDGLELGAIAATLQKN